MSSCRVFFPIVTWPVSMRAWGVHWQAAQPAAPQLRPSPARGRRGGGRAAAAMAESALRWLHALGPSTIPIAQTGTHKLRAAALTCDLLVEQQQ